MDTYDYGDAVTVDIAFTDIDGVATDPTTITLEYEDPSGNQTSLTYADTELTRTGVGEYNYVIDTDEQGTWPFRWIGTGAVDVVEEDCFYVKSSDFASAALPETFTDLEMLRALLDDLEITESQTLAFSQAGTLTTGTGTFRIYSSGTATWTIAQVRASVATAPTGATLKVDVNKNGTTIFTDQANRPTIAISGSTDLADAMDVSTITSGDYFTIDIDQVGSTIAGANLTVQIYLTRAL